MLWTYHPLAAASVHERLRFDFVRLLIAFLGAQRIHQQASRLCLRSLVAAGEREGFAGAALRLVRIAFHQPYPPELDPQQRIVRLDT